MGGQHQVGVDFTGSRQTVSTVDTNWAEEDANVHILHDLDRDGQVDIYCINDNCFLFNDKFGYKVSPQHRSVLGPNCPVDMATVKAGANAEFSTGVQEGKRIWTEFREAVLANKVQAVETDLTGNGSAWSILVFIGTGGEEYRVYLGKMHEGKKRIKDSFDNDRSLSQMSVSSHVDEVIIEKGKPSSREESQHAFIDPNLLEPIQFYLDFLDRPETAH